MDNTLHAPSRVFLYLFRLHAKILKFDCCCQVYWNLLLPTNLNGLAFRHREGKYNTCPIFIKFAWLISHPEFQSFETLVWDTHLPALHNVDAHQATLNGILQAVLITQHAAVGTNTKLVEITSKLGAVASTAATSASDIADCKRAARTKDTCA